MGEVFAVETGAGVTGGPLAVEQDGYDRAPAGCSDEAPAFTRGPWSPLPGDNGVVCLLDGRGHFANLRMVREMPDHEARANVALAVAAPELLVALMKGDALVQSLSKEVARLSHSPEHSYFNAEIGEFYERCGEALAKARGEARKPNVEPPFLDIFKADVEGARE